MPISKVNGKLEKVDPDEVEIGSTIIVQPGEKVPLDGIVAGRQLQPEHQCADRREPAARGQTGRRNHQRLHQHDRLAQNHRPPKSLANPLSPRFWIWWRTPAPASPDRRTSSPNLPVSIHRRSAISALALAVLPPVFRMLVMGLHAPMWSQWIYRALTFLVISCPCALVISIPLSFLCRNRRCQQGRVFWSKAPTIWKPFPRPKCVVFDKTGTLTQGVFEVNGIHHSNIQRGPAGRVRCPCGKRFLPSNQQEPAAGIRQGAGPQPCDRCAGNQRQRRYRYSGWYARLQPATTS